MAKIEKKNKSGFNLLREWIPTGKTSSSKYIPSSNSDPVRSVAFVEALQMAMGQGQSMDLDVWMQKLDEKGKALVDNPTADNLAVFRGLVKDLLRYAHETGQNIQRIADRRLRNPKQVVEYELVRINQEMERLSESVLSKHQQVTLASRVEKIKGMLLSLLA